MVLQNIDGRERPAVWQWEMILGIEQAELRNALWDAEPMEITSLELR